MNVLNLVKQNVSKTNRNSTSFKYRLGIIHLVRMQNFVNISYPWIRTCTEEMLVSRKFLRTY